jgi:hypothetical protein
LLSICFKPERDAARVRIDPEHHRLDHVADVEQLRRVLDPLAPGHLRDVDQALDPLGQLDERAEAGDPHHLALDHVADLGRGEEVVPDIGRKLLQAE